jgi:hypothetical protein
MKKRNPSPAAAVLPMKPQTTEDLVKAVKSLHQPDVHPYNFKIPMDLYADIQEHLEQSGQTLKNLLIFSIKAYLKNNRLEN